MGRPERKIDCPHCQEQIKKSELTEEGRKQVQSLAASLRGDMSTGRHRPDMEKDGANYDKLTQPKTAAAKERRKDGDE